MRGVTLPDAPSRIKGKRSLFARLQKLTLAAYKFGQHRAATRDDLAFSHALFDGLRQTLDAIEEDR